MNPFKWIADMWERDSRFRQDRRVERYAREHPGTRVVEAFDRLWIDSTPRPLDLDGIHPSALGGLMGPGAAPTLSIEGFQRAANDLMQIDLDRYKLKAHELSLLTDADPEC